MYVPHKDLQFTVGTNPYFLMYTLDFIHGHIVGVHTVSVDTVTPKATEMEKLT